MWGCGRGWFWQRVPAGYTYVGPCRCGTGPHAFYQDPSGRIVPAWHFWRFGFSPTKEDLKTELETLKAEKAELEKHIKEIEEQIKEKE